MKKILLIILCYIVICNAYINGASISGNKSLKILFSMGAKNLNYSSPVPENDIISLCSNMENLARKEKDYANLFRISQIAVNSHCLKGDMGFALDKAEQMQKESAKYDTPLYSALAIQALGDTYMHSSQYEKAYKTFVDAENALKNTDDNFSKIRLALQQAHVCMYLNKTDEMQNYISEAYALLKNNKIDDKEDYILYVHCYRVVYHINTMNAEKARECIDIIKRTKRYDRFFNRWYYLLESLYSELTGEYDKALAYNDSTLKMIRENGNLNEYKNSIIEKAALLEKTGKKKDACFLYSEANLLDDSLNSEAYLRQIDSLRVSYKVNQLEIENTVAHNKLLTWSLIYSFIIGIIATLFIFIAAKKNKRLTESKKRLKRIRQEAEASIHSKSLFLSNMSHELRTPLNAIVGFSEILTSEDIIDPELRQQCSTTIKQNSELLMKLINDITDLSSLERNKMNFTYSQYDAVEICRNVLNTVENVKQTTAALHFETDLDKLELITDAARLQQVLINLLINATKFTKEGTITLKLDISKDSQEAIFTIEDTGCGIPKEKQANIFKRFEKLHEGIQGAGLGLSICTLIAENIGGKLQLDPDYTEGARFIFIHPINPKTVKNNDNQ